MNYNCTGSRAFSASLVSNSPQAKSNCVNTVCENDDFDGMFIASIELKACVAQSFGNVREKPRSVRYFFNFTWKTASV